MVFSISFGANKSKNSFNQQGSFDRTDMPIVPDWLQSTTTGLNTAIQNLGQMDPYQFVPGANPLQMQAANTAGGLNPRSWNYDAAIDLTKGIATGKTPSVTAGSVLDNLDAYMSPYTGQVVDAALADFDFGAGQTRAQQALDMAGAGAFSGSGAALTRAATEDALTRGRAATSANLRDSGFRFGAGLSADDANRRQSASLANAQLEMQNRAQQQSAAQQIANLSSQLAGDERANIATQAGIGEMLRGIEGETVRAPIDFLAQQIAMLSGLPLDLFVGSRSTGTETQSGSGKLSGMSFGAGWKSQG